MDIVKLSEHPEIDESIKAQGQRPGYRTRRKTRRQTRRKTRRKTVRKTRRNTKSKISLAATGVRYEK